MIGLAAALVFALTAFAGGASVMADGEVSSADVFRDVKTDSWFKASVDYVYNTGLMKGTSGTKFEPETKMSRAMLVTVLWRYEGSPEGFANNFKDVPADTWYTDAVCWAGENGIVSGVANRVFDPEGDITREQLTTIVYRYTQYMGCDVSAAKSVSGFPDGASVSDWAIKGMEWAIAEGIITGTKNLKGKTVLAPADNATRAEVATVLMRYCSNERYIHEWDEGTKVSDPTCTEKGEIVYKCADCDAEKHVAISALGHVKTQESVTKTATCTENGNLHFYCTRCEKWCDEAIDKVPHSWTAATCTTPKTCSVCHKTSGSALGHSWQAATCTTPKKCSRCGETSGNVLGHTDTPVCTRCGRNNRAVLISCLERDVEKDGGELLLSSIEFSYSSLWVSTDNRLVYENVIAVPEGHLCFQLIIDDNPTFWYVEYLEDNYGQHGILGNYTMKHSAITKNTGKLDYTESAGLTDNSDVEACREAAATSLKTALELLNSYMKYYYGFSVHALGYTNYN